MSRVTTPLKLGVVTLGDFGAAGAAMGETEVNPKYSYATVTRALIRAFNKHGGIAGRRIDAVEHVIDLKGNWATDYQAACAAFTQDNHVAAAISVLGSSYSESYANCMAKVPNIYTYTGGGTDESDHRRIPLMFSVNEPTVDRILSTTLVRLAQAGFLPRNSRLGVIVDGCPSSSRAYDAVIPPLAARLHLALTRYDVDCTTQFSDLGSYEAEVANAVLPFHSRGVDHVMFVSGIQDIGMLTFARAAEQQGYHPDYMANSQAFLAAFGTSYPAGQLPHLHGIGWLPDADADPRTHASPVSKRCYAMLEGEGLVAPTRAIDRHLYDSSCDAFFLLESALRSSRGRSEVSSLATALDTLGASFLSAGGINGASRFATDKHDGPVLFAPFGYFAGCACWKYTAAPSPG